uniref:EF-hand domain-containing protein n=1 Tax=Plectus sambesii TaxID=2011161 RepID=A0A914X1H7_9BILA
LTLADLVRAQQPPVPAHDDAASQHKFGAHDEVHDADHIKQHLENQIDTDKLELNEEQKRFHYFSMHDLNKDNRIDGNEIIKAMAHEHTSAMDGNRDQAPLSEAALETLTDSILQEIDYNNDGYVDYAEYIRNLD